MTFFKKSVATLLILAMMLPLAIPGSATEIPQANVPVEPFTTELTLSTCTSPEEIGLLNVDLSRNITGSKRGEEPDDNLVFPGPLAIKSAYSTKGKSSIYLTAYRPNRNKQYYCMMIFQGDNLDAEPVATDYRLFTSPLGYDTVVLHWEKQNATPGMYTLVTFTGEEQGNMIVPVKDTASMTDIYVYDGTVPTPTDFYIVDSQTGIQMDTITIPFGGTSVLEVMRTPLPSDGSYYATLTPKLVEAKDAGGYLIVNPLRYGRETVTLKCGERTKQFTLEVCNYPDGHKYYDPIPAGTATAETSGCTLYYCTGCGYVKKEYTPSYTEIFEGFQDIPGNSWYYDSVKEAVKLNLFNGVNATTFGPDRPMTRAMLVTVLWRYEGEPDAATSNFVDVSSNAWYARAVSWAAEKEIVNGVGNGKFNPDGTITREQLATILYRYAEKKSLNIQISADLNSYPDGKDISSWAKNAFSWAVGYGLIGGVKSGNIVTLSPQGHATRAQVGTILVRFIEQSEEEKAVLPDLSAGIGGTLENAEGLNITWVLTEEGLLQIGGKVPAGLKLDKWKMPWYSHREQITAVEFLNGVEYVWENAFSSYPNLHRVIFAPTVLAVEDTAFYNCSVLEEISFSDGIESLGSAAFQSCTALEQVDLPQSLLHLGVSAFAGCISLKVANMPQNLKTIGNAAFKICHSLETIALPDSVQQMGASVFRDCSALKQAILPAGLTELKEETFYGCKNLTDVTLPIALEKMGLGVFYRCAALEELVFPATLRVIYTGTFTECTSLRSLYFMGYFLSIGTFTDYSLPYHTNEPFGPWRQVTVYGIVGSMVESCAEEYDYPFEDILTVLS